MQHCEQETLALLALGEPAASAEDDRHLTGCPRCQSELASLRAVVAAGRQITPADRPVSPPPAVWDRITAELGIAAEQRDLPIHEAGPTDQPGGAVDVGSPAEEGPGTPVDSLEARRTRGWRRRTVLLTAAAAVVGMLAGVAGAGLIRRDAPTTSVVTATTALKPLSVAEASGTAALHRSATGRTLSVAITGLRQVPDGFYEVWLADTATKKMVAVGVLDTADQGSFDVPAGLNLAEYRVVDVSLQAFDGNPLHSAISVVRGTFPA